jgi:SAM-dependent methyltransferase
MAETPFVYDVVSYPDNVMPQLHPSRLAVMARLHGIAVALPSRCRFLEVGCGSGATLLSLALSYPEAEFVGVDLSKEAIAQGEAYRSKLGLKNLTFVAADLAKWTPPGGDFDYIVAHGFYSWVPGFVRDALFKICQERLAPAGVGYVSYNAMPGCHIRRMLWEMLHFHVKDIPEPQKKIEQAIALMQFLVVGATGNGAELLKHEASRLAERTDPAVVFHDDLSEINDPLSITDFMKHAGAFGLQFLAEADYFEMTVDLMPQGVAKMLNALAEKNVIVKEQYLDFLKMRRFRQTLLCRAEQTRLAKPDPDVVPGFHVTCQAQSTPSPADLKPGVPVKFNSPQGAAATFDHPFVKSAFVHLNDVFPYPLSYDEVLEETHQRTENAYRSEADEFRGFFRKVFVEGYRIGLVELYAEPPRFARKPSAKPRLSPLARVHLEDGREIVTSFRPSVVRLESPITREMLRLLDGTRDEATLLTDLAERAAASPELRDPKDPPQSAAWWRDTLAPQVRPSLEKAARLGVLVEE